MERKAIYSDEDLSSEYRKAGMTWDFHDEETQIHLHTLHPYPAKFIPQIPRKAILLWSREGDTVLDPFCGCGTTLLESSLLHRKSIGVDNNEVACLVSRAKVAQYTDDDLRKLKEFVNIITHIDHNIDKGWTPNYENFEYWFDPICAKELTIIKHHIEHYSNSVKLLLLSIFSSIIVRVSYQDSDTRYSRIYRDYQQGEATKAFQKKLLDVIKKLEVIIDLPKSPGEIYLADSRKLDFIKDETIHLIITSPPYLNAYDYHKYHRHRLHWIKGNIKMARDKEIGKHDTFTRKGATPDAFFWDMEECFSHWKRVLKTGGRAFIVIGDAIVSGEPVQVGDRFVDICEMLGLRLVDRWIRELHSSKRAFNIKKARRIDKEHLLLFEKKE